MPSDPEAETREAPSGPEIETKDEAGPATWSTDLEGPVAPALRMLTISGNFPPNNVIAHVESTGARRRGRSSAAKLSADDQRSQRGRRRGERVGVRRREIDDFANGGGDTGTDNGGHVNGTENRQQPMDLLEMEEGRKARRK